MGDSQRVLANIRQNLLPNGGFDAVVHLAALAGATPSMERPLDYEFTNVIGTIRLLDHCRWFRTPRFVFASSSDLGDQDPVQESPCALTKLQGEQWGRLYARQHGLRFVAMRLPRVADPDPAGIAKVCHAVDLALFWPGPGATVLDVGPA